jgi:hypothetical protein
MKIIILLIIIFVILFYINRSAFGNTQDNLTVVSGYWKVGNKYSHNKYDEWFKNTLSINQRYIFFCDSGDVNYIKGFRKNKETLFIDYPLKSFYTSKFASDSWIDKIHVPSKELGMIWNEKMYLIKKAKDLDPNPTEFYIWIDAGVSPYRDKSPPSKRLNVTVDLPHDKLCYSYVKEKEHNFAATVLIMHRDIIDHLVELYYTYLEKCNESLCGSDQVIFTAMLKDHPELFYKISEGYGENLVALYN